MLVEIHIPRPVSLLLFVFGCTGWYLWLNSAPNAQSTTASIIQNSSSSSVASQTALPDAGGNTEASNSKIVQAEQQVFFARQAHALLDKKEDLLRYQLKLVEEEQSLLGDSIDEETELAFTDARTNLVKLLQDKTNAEIQIKNALNQLWDARVQGSEISATASGEVPTLKWPVEPSGGISATFRDPEYEKLFGFAHDGLDIPAMQGTTIVAPADGTVEKVADNGYGYSYIIIRHAGIATLYGHVSHIDVVKGETVTMGQKIGETGGRPGSLGAGTNTTGPHLHFEVIKNGQRVDPLTVLELRSGI